MSPYREDVAVVGAGLMGVGISYVLAAAGHRVELCDPDPEARSAVKARLAEIGDQLDADSNWPPIRVHAELAEAVAGAELVIEAAPERLELKRTIFRELEGLAPPGAIFATNTSAIPVAEITVDLRDRGRVLGTHFWNPPHLVPLVEVVEAEATDPEIVGRVISLFRAAGMKPVHVRADIPGFIGNRLQHALKREAIALVAAGHCDAAALDDVVKHGFGARLAVLGPLEQSDLVGLELTLAIHRTLMPSLDRAEEPNPLLVEKVERGETGAAAGRGFHDWPAGRAETLREEVEAALARKRREAAHLENAAEIGAR